MNPETVLLSRIQFAFTIGYHILWPAYSIGLSGFIVLLNILWLRTRRPVYRDLLRFWIHLFALGFAMGVVTGVVLSYEIGTNWSVFADADEQCHRAVLHLRSPDRLFSGGWLYWDHAVRHGPGQRGAAPLFLHHGGAGRLVQRVLDTRSQQLDANPGRVHDRRRPVSDRQTGGARSSTRPFPIASRIW